MAWASLAACHPLGQSILTGCVLSLRHTRKRFFFFADDDDDDAHGRRRT